MLLTRSVHGAGVRNVVVAIAAAALMMAAGCQGGGGGGGGGNTNDGGGGGGNTNDGGGGGGGGGGGNRQLRVAFTGNPTGLFAIAKDDESGTEFTFFADRDAEGNTIITEVNARTSGGKIVKTSLDGAGQPVNFRGNDGVAANVLFKSDGSAKVVLVNSMTNETDVADNLMVSGGPTSRKQSALTLQSTGDAQLDLLRGGLSRYMETVPRLFPSECGDDAGPQCGSSLAGPSRSVVDLVSLLTVEVKVTQEVLEPDVVIDEAPEALNVLQGTWNLCARSDFPSLEEFNIANKLTFGSEDEPYRLITELDRGNVFTLSSEVTINYLTGEPFLLDLEGQVLRFTPVYTATSLSEDGRLFVDRRFHVELVFSNDVEDFETATTREINAALEDGFIDEAGVLTFNLRIFDIEEAGLQLNPPVALSYVRQNEPPCSGNTPVQIAAIEISCPVGPLGLYDNAMLSVVVPTNFVDPLVEWYVIAGDAFLGDADDFQTELLVLDTTPLRIGVVVSDAEGKFATGECGILIGQADNVDDTPVGDLPYTFNCPPNVEAGVPVYVEAQPLSVPVLDDPLWEVVYTSGGGEGDFVIEDEESDATTITFLTPGVADIRFSAYDPAIDDYLIVLCTVEITGDGIVSTDDTVSFTLTWDVPADLDLSVLDPFGEELSYANTLSFSGGQHGGDADGDVSSAEEVVWDGDAPLGRYEAVVGAYFADGPVAFTLTIAVNGAVTDVSCVIVPGEVFTAALLDLDPLGGFVSPACDEGAGSFDFCEAMGYYNDGECDSDCPLPDPDCDFDICAVNGYYGDLFCDLDICALPDPDCDDPCVLDGRYDDGFCDVDCSQPDPDCSTGGGDFCAENGLYSDGFCDDCPSPDPDCDDFCVIEGRYGDGFCDPDCPLPDPDC